MIRSTPSKSTAHGACTVLLFAAGLTACVFLSLAPPASSDPGSTVGQLAQAPGDLPMPGLPDRAGESGGFDTDTLPAPLGGDMFGSDPLSGFGGPAQNVSANFDENQLTVTLRINPQWHVYGTKEVRGGPIPAEITIFPQQAVTATGPAKTQDGETKWDAIFQANIHQHQDEVTWRIPIRLTNPAAIDGLTIKGTVGGQGCSDSGRCIPFTIPFTARYQASASTGGFQPDAGTGGLSSPDGSFPIGSELPDSTTPTQTPITMGAQTEFRAPEDSVTLSGMVNLRSVAPGETVTIKLIVTPDEDWHIYQYESPITSEQINPTILQLDLPEGWTVTRLTSSKTPITVEKQDWMEPEDVYSYYDGQVVFTIDIAVPEDAAQADYAFSGIIGYQDCSSQGMCLPPIAARFSGEWTVQPNPVPKPAKLTFTGATYDEAKQLAMASPPLALTTEAGPAETLPDDMPADQVFSRVIETLDQEKAQQAAAAKANFNWVNFAVTLVFGFLGGVILNIMPCVLPVISLKLFALVQHSGESRGRIFYLNAWYSIGLISVFMLLATMVAFAGMSWGEQFTLVWFKVGLTVMVFALALSLFGVWEIPIPGFVGSEKMMELQSKEGALGAFFTGVVTTLLATPCSAPFLGTTFGFLLGQPPIVVFAIFASVGLGMASPYLIIGIAPELIRFFPRPGAWMETFKHVMGFVLLGTVVYLFTTVGAEWFVPTFALLIGVWLACWWIGEVPLTAKRGWRIAAWIGGPAVAVAVGYFAFTLLSEPSLTWQPMTKQAAETALKEERLVVLALTADSGREAIDNPMWAMDTPSIRNALFRRDAKLLVLDESTGASQAAMKEISRLLNVTLPSVIVFPLDRKRLPPVELPYESFEEDVAAVFETLQWEPYSPLALEEARQAGYTVMVDFTADWCPNCKYNSATAIETRKVAELVEKNNVVTMLADWTSRSAVIKNALTKLGNPSIPLLVVYPAGKLDEEPIILRDVVTQAQVLAALEEAGPSKATDGMISASKTQPAASLDPTALPDPTGLPAPTGLPSP